jgi:hypothetical protein
MYQVVCGNIGTVYQGNNQDEALKTYYEYVGLSNRYYNMATGEDVVIFREDGSILFEHAGSNRRHE